MMHWCYVYRQFNVVNSLLFLYDYYEYKNNDIIETILTKVQMCTNALKINNHYIEYYKYLHKTEPDSKVEKIFTKAHNKHLKKY